MFLGQLKHLRQVLTAKLSLKTDSLKNTKKKLMKLCEEELQNIRKKLSTRGAYITDAIITQGTNPL